MDILWCRPCRRVAKSRSRLFSSNRVWFTLTISDWLSSSHAANERIKIVRKNLLTFTCTDILIMSYKNLISSRQLVVKLQVFLFTFCMFVSVTSMSPQLPAAWTCLHMSSMQLCSLSKTQTKQAMASLLNCMRSWRWRLSSSSLLCSNVARKPLAFSLRGGGGGDASKYKKEVVMYAHGWNQQNRKYTVNALNLNL